jgi:hypothetical protein
LFYFSLFLMGRGGFSIFMYQMIRAVREHESN